MLAGLRRGALTVTELEAEEIDFLGAPYGRDLILRCLESAWRSRLAVRCDAREAEKVFGFNEPVWALTPRGQREPTSLGTLFGTVRSRAGAGITLAAAGSTVLGLSVGGLSASPIVEGGLVFIALYAGVLCALYRVYRDGASPFRIARELPWLWGEHQAAREVTIASRELVGRSIPGFVVVGVLSARQAAWPDPPPVVIGLSLLTYAVLGTWLIRAWLKLNRAAKADKRAEARRCGNWPATQGPTSSSGSRGRKGLPDRAR